MSMLLIRQRLRGSPDPLEGSFNAGDERSEWFKEQSARRAKLTSPRSSRLLTTRLAVSRADGSASFAGVERFSGELDGCSGTFILQNSGTLDGGEVSGSWFVVPGSGTEGFTGLRGEGGFQTEIGYFLDYWFE